jgi:hypothetical protein
MDDLFEYLNDSSYSMVADDTQHKDKVVFMENSQYLDNLEQWIDGIIMQDGLADAHIASNDNEKDTHNWHELMVETYKKLLG